MPADIFAVLKGVKDQLENLTALREAVSWIEQWTRRKTGVSREQVPMLLQATVEVLEVIHAQRDRTQELHDLHHVVHGLNARCHLALQLYLHRQSTGLTLQALADRVHLAQPYLGLIEKAGVGLPSIEGAQLLLEELGIPVLSRGFQQVSPALPDWESATDSERGRAMRQLRKLLPKLGADQLSAVAEIARVLAKERVAA